MEKRELTPFGLAVKTKLLNPPHTQKWLLGKVHEDTGLFIDSGYAYKIFTGERSAPKVVESISKILGISACVEK